MKIIIKMLLALALTNIPVAFAESASYLGEPISKQDKLQFEKHVPKGFVLFDLIKGDLNKDGKKDAVLIIKDTKPENWVSDEYRGELDRNRRGIIVLINDNGTFKKIVENRTAFSSENEEGGVYFAPDLWFEIKKNNLYVSYGHGRYGWWGYTFRIEGADLRLIGYESSSNHGPYVDYQTSVNFLTQKKLRRENINMDDRDKPERFREVWSNVKYQPIYLSTIEDFDEFSFE